MVHNYSCDSLKLLLVSLRSQNVIDRLSCEVAILYPYKYSSMGCHVYVRVVNVVVWDENFLQAFVFSNLTQFWAHLKGSLHQSGLALISCSQAFWFSLSGCECHFFGGSVHSYPKMFKFTGKFCQVIFF